MNKKLPGHLLKTENEQLKKLHEIVLKTIGEEKLISERIKEFEEQHPSFSSRVADKVATFGGSWKFILAFAFIMTLWMTVNSVVLKKSFDPFPYILLNLLLSTLAAIQAPIIMMSQNRKEEKDRLRAINDYMINLKAEIEVRNLHKKLDLLMEEQMKTLFEIQRTQIAIMEDIQAALKEK